MASSRRASRSPGWLLLPACLLLLGAGGEDVRTLGPGAAAERSLAPGETHHYALALEPGSFARLAVEQHGIDVAVRVTRAGGALETEVDRLGGRFVTEGLSLLTADAAASFLLEIRTQPGTEGPGTYVLRVEEWRPAVPADRVRIAAERAEAAADGLYRRSTAQGFADAQTAYGEALAHWREIGNAAKESEILLRLGLIHQRRGEKQDALRRFDEALAIERRLGDSFWQATTLNQKGLLLEDLGDAPGALAVFAEALALRRAAGDQELAGAVLNNIGLVHHQQGDLKEARTAFLQALEIFHRTAGSDRRREASTLGNLGSVHDALGEPLEALRFHQEQLALARALDDRKLQATALNNLGLVQHKLGEAQAAFESYSAALALARGLGDRDREAAALANLATLALELGEPEAAVATYGRVLEIHRGTGWRAGEAATLANLGRAQAALGQSAEALAAFRQALAMQHEIGDRAGEAATLCHLGAELTAQGRPREALEPLGRALEIARAEGNRSTEALAAYGQGVALAAQGNAEAALAPLQESLRLRQAVSDPAGEVASREQIARAEMARGRLDAARSELETSLDQAESLRSRIAADRLRSSYLASVQDVYETYVEVLMTLHEKQPDGGFAALAFEASERARARGLLDLLRQARVEIRRGADPALLDAERRRRVELDAKAESLTLLLQGPHSDRQAAVARGDLDEALSAYELAESRLQAALPAYAGLVRSPPLHLSDAQALLDPETVLLEYSLGARRSFVWLVTPSSLTVRELPGRAEVTAAAQEVQRLLGAPAAGADPHRREALARLGEMLLAPVADQLADRRLAIVAPDVLQYIPFAALPLPAGELVVERHEVVSLPSAAVLRELRQKPAGRPAVTGELAILADPVFRPDDPRVAKAAPAAPPPAAEALPGSDAGRLSRDLGPDGFQRLSWTRREAEAVASQAGAGKAALSLDFQASLDTVKGPELAHFRRLHFATHGLLDDRHPELSGLVLSLVDEQGKPRNGFLRLTDVFNLEIGADLVVLSGCRTALGKEVRGEGLMGLTRGFFYAGASRVVASLWPVRDRATAELMEKFYRALLRDGRQAPAALRAAQLAMRHDPRWRDPYYWAPFTAHGEW